MRTLDFLGLDETKVQNVVNGLSGLLADLQVYYTNLRGFHWNVSGRNFYIMHQKYEEFYNDAAEKIDEVAERMLQLGGVPESRFSEYLKVSALATEAGDDVTVSLMSDYLKGQEKAVWMLVAYSKRHGQDSGSCGCGNK
ncbi:Dps family protein [Prevotella koreensis]